ncbi:MAG: hypothetical protein ACTSU3_05670 [Candidatus Thorarchaeota archaeon]
MNNDQQREWEERYKREESEKSKAVYADLTFFSTWAIVIVYSLLVYSWQGYAELYNQATPESTLFNQSTVFLLFTFAIIVAVFYIRFKLNRRRSIAKSK